MCTSDRHTPLKDNLLLAQTFLGFPYRYLLSSMARVFQVCDRGGVCVFNVIVSKSTYRHVECVDVLYI